MRLQQIDISFNSPPKVEHNADFILTKVKRKRLCSFGTQMKTLNENFAHIPPLSYSPKPRKVIEQEYCGLTLKAIMEN